MTTAIVPTKRTAIATAPVCWRRTAYRDLRVEIGQGANRTKLGRAWRAIEAVLADLEQGRADEHGGAAWSVGASFHKRGGGEAVNRSVYGVDIVQRQPLGVVVVRRWRRSRWQAKHDLYGSTSRMWLLVGRNELTGNAFAHPINPRPIVKVLGSTTPPDLPVTLARAWVFDVEPAMLPRILRHGDVALVPVRRLPGGRRERVVGEPDGVQVIDRHVLQSREAWRVGSRLYALDPYLQHLGEQHVDVMGTGWYRVQVGLRVTDRPFARATAD